MTDQSDNDTCKNSLDMVAVTIDGNEIAAKDNMMESVETVIAAAVHDDTPLRIMDQSHESLLLGQLFMLNESLPTHILNIQLPQQTTSEFSTENRHHTVPIFPATLSKGTSAWIQYDVVLFTPSMTSLYEISRTPSDKDVKKTRSTDIDAIQIVHNDRGIINSSLSIQKNDKNEMDEMLRENETKTGESSNVVAVVTDDISDWIVVGYDIVEATSNCQKYSNGVDEVVPKLSPFDAKPELSFEQGMTTQTVVDADPVTAAPILDVNVALTTSNAVDFFKADVANVVPRVSDTIGTVDNCGHDSTDLNGAINTDVLEIKESNIPHDKSMVQQHCSPEATSLLLGTLHQFQTIQNCVPECSIHRSFTEQLPSFMIPIRSNTVIESNNSSPTFPANLTKFSCNNSMIQSDMISTAITSPFILFQQPIHTPNTAHQSPARVVEEHPVVMLSSPDACDSAEITLIRDAVNLPVAAVSVKHLNRNTSSEKAAGKCTSKVTITFEKIIPSGPTYEKRFANIFLADENIEEADAEANADDVIFIGDIDLVVHEQTEREIQNVPTIEVEWIVSPDEIGHIVAAQSLSGEHDDTQSEILLTCADGTDKEVIVSRDTSPIDEVQYGKDEFIGTAFYEDKSQQNTVALTPLDVSLHCNGEMPRGIDLKQQMVVNKIIVDSSPVFTVMSENETDLKDDHFLKSECVGKERGGTVMCPVQSDETVIKNDESPSIHVIGDNLVDSSIVHDLPAVRTPIVEDTGVLFLGNVNEYEDEVLGVEGKCNGYKTSSEHLGMPLPASEAIGEHDTIINVQKLYTDVDVLTQQNTSMSTSTSTEGNENLTAETASTKENHQQTNKEEQALQKIIPSVITTVTARTNTSEAPLKVSYAAIAKKSNFTSTIPAAESNKKPALVVKSGNGTSAKESFGSAVKESTKITVTDQSKSRSGIYTGSRFVPSLGGVIKAAPLKKQKNDDIAVRNVKTRREVTASTAEPHVLVLTSTTMRINGSKDVLKRQTKALTYMESNEIQYKVLDSTDTLHQHECTGLYMLSRMSNVYPQFFHIDATGIPVFCGTMDGIENMIEDGSFLRKFGGCHKQVTGISAPPEENLSFDAAFTTAERMEFNNDGTVHIATFGKESSKNIEPKATTEVTKSIEGTSEETNPIASTNRGTKKKDGKNNSKVSPSAEAMRENVEPRELVKSEITVYGATSFVAKHAFDYFMQVSLSIRGDRIITLAGRNKQKLLGLQAVLTEKMANLTMTTPKPIGKCIFDTVVADSVDIAALSDMVQRTQVVANFAGPYSKYGEYVLAACAKYGTDYIDITGEISWAGQMRQRYSDIAKSSGARIISLCGFDSIPSDLAIFGAVDALRRARRSNVEIEAGTCWHSSAGMANGGTIHSALGIPLKLRYCFSQPMPYLLDDPLVLTHPQTRFDPNIQEVKNRMAKVEWLNQLPSFDSILVLGASAPFFMAPINAKVVHATSVALSYGPNFTYRERFLPLGMAPTRRMGLLSIIPALMVQFGLLILAAILMTPYLGKFLADWLAPPGSGAPDYACKAGFAHVYAEVSTKSDTRLMVDKANCSINFAGDPGNWVTAQCVCESALALILDKGKLPPRSKDGFGTPAEIFGNVLLNRLQSTTVRPVKIKTHVRKDVPQHETVVFV